MSNPAKLKAVVMLSKTACGVRLNAKRNIVVQINLTLGYPLLRILVVPIIKLL
jgi:hypothetical protein